MARSEFEEYRAAIKQSVENMGKHHVAGCSPLSTTGIDAVLEITASIYSICKAMEFAHRRTAGQDAALEDINPELMACCFDGLSYLAAMADYHASYEAMR